MLKRLFILAAALPLLAFGWHEEARAQTAVAVAGNTCPSSNTVPVGFNAPLVETQYGALCTNATFSGSVTATINSVGATGAAVPGSADYLGLNSSGNLIGALAGAHGGLVIEGVASGTTVPVTAAQSTAANLNATVVGTGTFAVQASLAPATSGGLSSYVLEPAASDNHANIKNGAGQVFHIVAFNNSATINYLRLYNAASGFNGCNSATNLVWEMHIPANSTNDAGFVEDIPNGLAFSTGISICVTGAYGQTNTTNATASAISISIGYK